MNSVSSSSSESDASAYAAVCYAGETSAAREVRFAALRVLIVVANEGRPHAICARAFGSGRSFAAVHWLADANAAREVLASAPIDLAVLDTRHHGTALLEDVPHLAPTTAVILLGEAPEHLDRLPSACTSLPRDAFCETQLLTAINRVLTRRAAKWVTTRAHPGRDGGPSSGDIDRVVDFSADSAEADRGALSESDQSCACVLRHLPVIVGRMDREGRILELGGAGLARLGIDREPLIGGPFCDTFPAAREALRAALAGETSHFEMCVERERTDVRCVRFDLFPDHEAGGAVGVLGQEVPVRSSAGDEVLRAVDSERNRIGADLHDEVGQLLTGITCLSTALVERLRGRDDLAAEDAIAIAQTAKEALAQIRSLAHGLAPVHLSRHGLACALDEFASLVRRMHNVELRIDLPRNHAELEAETATHVFRIVQEAVANAIRHGGATMVSLSLRRMGAIYRLTVTDNGCGFDSDTSSDGTGSGLRLMEYRAALIGGSVRVTSSTQRGTRVEVSFTPSTPRTHETAC